MKTEKDDLEFKDLTKKGLLTLVEEYDGYIKFLVKENEDFEECTPQTMEEFLNNDMKAEFLDDIGSLSDSYEEDAKAIMEVLEIEDDTKIDELVSCLLEHDGFIET